MLWAFFLPKSLSLEKGPQIICFGVASLRAETHYGAPVCHAPFGLALSVRSGV